MGYTKGFSLIEFLVVVALIGVLSMFFYTPKTTKWNTELSASQSKVVSFLKYYQKKSIRDGYKYYVRMNLDLTSNSFSIDAFVDTNITTRQSTCTVSTDNTFSERRLFESIKNIRVLGCQTGGKSCKNSSTANMGVCFFPNGSSAGTNNSTEWHITHTAGDNITHATNAYKFEVWKTTSFIETFSCKGNAAYTDINSTALACTTAEWITE